MSREVAKAFLDSMNGRQLLKAGAALAVSCTSRHGQVKAVKALLDEVEGREGIARKCWPLAGTRRASSTKRRR